LKENTHRTKGRVSFSKAPIVSYISRDGQKRTCATGSYSYPPAYSIGEKVKIFYDSSKPNHARMGTSIRHSITLISIGGAIFILVLIIFLLTVSKEKTSKLLIQTGIKIAADIVSVYYDKSTTVMGKRPFVINCQWLQTHNNTVYTFKSKYIWFDPAPYLGERKQSDVFIDPNDPKKYYMDLSFLPEKG
jgi:hypothetical protein